jgi:HEAT repeat protein
MLALPLGTALLLLATAPAAADGPDQWVARLQSDDPAARRLAAEALGKQKAAAAAPALAKLLADPERPVREAAAEALVQIGPKAVPHLAGALKGDAESGRLAAADALARLGPAAAPAVPALADALKDKSVDVRIRSAVALGKVGPAARSALPALFAAGKDTGNLGQILRYGLPSSVAEAAVEAALKVDPGCADRLAAAVLPDLTAALAGKDAAAVQAAASALARLGPAARPALPALRAARKTARGFAESITSRALQAVLGAEPALIELASDRKERVENRLQALSDLGYLRDISERGAQALADALEDPEPMVRGRAAMALGVVGPKAKAAVPKLLAVLGDEELERGALQTRIDGQDPVANALASIGAPAVAGLAGASSTTRAPSRWPAGTRPRPSPSWGARPGRRCRRWRSTCRTSYWRWPWSRPAPTSGPAGTRRRRCRCWRRG